MRLLIVEDEYLIRERIAFGINWSQHGMELVDAVENGRAALELIMKDHIDLVITDIRMPDMSGLELARELYERYPDMKVIVITGYDDFEYARESINYRIYKYLVKPVANEQLLDEVLAVKKIHEQQLSDKHKLTLLEQKWQQQLPYIKESLYKNWLNNHYVQWEFEKKCRELNIPSLHEVIWPLVFDMDPIEVGNQRFMVSDRSLVQFSLLTIAREVFKDIKSIVLQDDDGMTVVLLVAPDDDDLSSDWQSQVHQHIQTLLTTVKDCMKLTASVGIGPISKELSFHPLGYKQCKQALLGRITQGNESINQYRDSQAVYSNWSKIQELEKELEVAIETGNITLIVKHIHQIIDIQFNQLETTVEEAKEVILRMVCLFARIIHTQGWTLSEILGSDYIRFEQYHILMSRNQVLDWMQYMAQKISKAILERRQTGTQLMINETIQYIRDHIHEEELSLYQVAEKLYVNYSYLSRTFKRLVGDSFSEYVLRLRMEKAKELLANGQLVYDTAARVGYKHVNYFSKAFMKYWGVKPSEIKK